MVYGNTVLNSVSHQVLHPEMMARTFLGQNSVCSTLANNTLCDQLSDATFFSFTTLARVRIHVVHEISTHSVYACFLFFSSDCLFYCLPSLSLLHTRASVKPSALWVRSRKLFTPHQNPFIFFSYQGPTMCHRGKSQFSKFMCSRSN